jgi:hypothetical protein
MIAGMQSLVVILMPVVLELTFLSLLLMELYLMQVLMQVEM